MKKAKVMLTAIGVLTIVGTALAFKSHKAAKGTTIYCDVVSHPSPNCPILPNHTTVLSSPVTSYCTFVPNATCTITYPININN